MKMSSKLSAVLLIACMLSAPQAHSMLRRPQQKQLPLKWQLLAGAAALLATKAIMESGHYEYSIDTAQCSDFPTWLQHPGDHRLSPIKEGDHEEGEIITTEMYCLKRVGHSPEIVKISKPIEG